MTDVQEQPEDVLLPASDALQRGRYAIHETPGGGWSVARATPLCERCQECGCGELQEAIPVPAMIVPFITGQAELSPASAMRMLKGLMPGGK